MILDYKGVKVAVSISVDDNGNSRILSGSYFDDNLTDLTQFDIDHLTILYQAELVTSKDDYSGLNS